MSVALPLPVSQTRTALQASTRPAKPASKTIIDHERFAAELKARHETKQALQARATREDQLRLTELANQRRRRLGSEAYQEDTGHAQPPTLQHLHQLEQHQVEAAQKAEELVGNL
jgi:hypothetical protein